MGERIGPSLGALARMGALAQLKTGDPRWAERFELYIAGIELYNGFSELTDPAEQRQRFEAELSDRSNLGKPLTPMPEKFLEVLADMPEATGNACPRAFRCGFVQPVRCPSRAFVLRNCVEGLSL